MNYNTSEVRVWAYLRQHGAKATPREVSLNCDVTEEEAEHLIRTMKMPELHLTRGYNVGASDYAQHKIQPWDIWLEYRLNPWDADIVKRLLRKKPGERRLDYEKIKHVCDECIRQIDAGIYEETPHAGLEREKSTTT